MLTMEAFRTYALANMMDLEAILSEVYSVFLLGKSDFALFDGGAHKGYHTKKMLDLPGCKRVYAVEADPFMAETLRKNMGDRLTVEVPKLNIVQMALQNNPDVKTIPWKSSSSHVGRSSIESANTNRATIWADNKDITYRDAMTVPATTIDSILASETLPVPFVKLDLEGADLLALRGASKTLANKRPIVAFENSIKAPEVHGFTLEEIIGYFDALGYVPMSFIGERLGRANWFSFFEAWAVPKEHVEWLADTVGRAIATRPV